MFLHFDIERKQKRRMGKETLECLLAVDVRCVVTTCLPEADCKVGSNPLK